MRRIFGLTILALTTISGFSGTTQAGDKWMPRPALVQALETKTDQRPAGVGIGLGRKAVVELFLGGRGDWTLVVTRSNGLSCIVGAGRDWTKIPAIVGDPT